MPNAFHGESIRDSSDKAEADGVALELLVITRSSVSPYREEVTTVRREAFSSDQEPDRSLRIDVRRHHQESSRKSEHNKTNTRHWLTRAHYNDPAIFQGPNVKAGWTTGILAKSPMARLESTPERPIVSRSCSAAAAGSRTG
jgi:hypothetical protein